jgi:hypothetical protein
LLSACLHAADSAPNPPPTPFSCPQVQVGILVSFQYVLDVSMGPAATSALGVVGILLVLASCLAIYTARTAVTSAAPPVTVS